MAKKQDAGKPRGMGKRSWENSKNVPAGAMPMAEAVAAVKKYKAPKFDQSVEVAIHLGIDPKQADQQLRGAIAMPNGIGKTKRVVAFCAGELAKEAIAAGAVKAGGEELVAEIEKGWLDFDVAIAAPDMMRIVSKLGRALGPKGLMPSPKAGTVTPKVVDAVKEYSAGKVEYRNDKAGNIHAVIGKMSFPDKDLVENLTHFVEVINKAKPKGAKGQYVKNIAISGTMTPGVQIEHSYE